MIHADVQKLQNFVRIPSFNVMNDKESGGPAYQACLEALKFIKAEAPSAQTFMMDFDNYPEFPKKVPNLVCLWEKGLGRKGRCLGLSGHVDVVGLINEAAWSPKPFDAEIVDGFIVGRGVTDMKSGTYSMVVAAERLMADPTVKDLCIVGIFTGDEEAMALNGSKHAMEWVFKNLPDVVPEAFFVAESASDIVFGDQKSDGRRGLIGGYLDFTGIGGHSGVGNFINPLTIGCNVMAALEMHGFARHSDPAWGNVTTFQPMAASAAWRWNVNVVPTTAVFDWSIRFTPNYDAEELTNLVHAISRRVLGDVIVRWKSKGMPVPKINIVVLRNYEEIQAYDAKLKAGEITTPTIKLVSREDIHAMPYVSEAGRLSASIDAAVFARFGFKPKNTRGSGNSDGRFVQLYFSDANGKPIETIEFGVPQNGGLKPGHPRFGREGGMHQINECLLIEDFLNQIDVTVDIFRGFFK